MRPYSEQILLALSKHSRLNCRQLAGHISHDYGKTKALVSYMRQNDKVMTDGEIDSLTAYSLSEKGLAEAIRIADTNGAMQTQVHHAAPAQGSTNEDAPTATQAPTPTAKPKEQRARQRPAPNSLDDLAHESLTGVSARPAADVAPIATEPVAEFPHATRFGLLNTGELVIMPGVRPLVILSPKATNDLRKVLGVALQ